MTTAMMLGPMLQLVGEPRRAVEVYRFVLDRIGDEDHVAALKVEGTLLLAAMLDRSTVDLEFHRLPEFRAQVEAQPNAPSIAFAPLALALAAGMNEPALRAQGLAQRVVADNARPLPEATGRPELFDVGCTILIYAEAYDETQAQLDTSISYAQQLGSLPHYVGMRQLRAWPGQRRGALAEAEADARTVLDADLPSFFRVQALAVLIEVLGERGASEAAGRELALEGHADGPAPAFHGVLEWFRGRLRLAAGRPADALVDLEAVGRRMLELGCLSPALAAWRSDAALAHLALGNPDEALRLCRQEVEFARALGAPRPARLRAASRRPRPWR